MINDLRPGVFSAYTVISGAPARRSEQFAAVCASAQGGEAGRLYRFTNAAEVDGVFQGGNLPFAAKLLLGIGVPQVICAAADVYGGGDAPAGMPDDDAYARAFAAVEEIENVGAVLCDCPRQSVQKLLLQSVLRSCDKLRERVAVLTADTVEAAQAAAQALNSERACLCYPACAHRSMTGGFVTACAFAGAMLASAPGAPLFGLTLPGNVALAGENLPEGDVQRLLRAGVSVFETSGGGVECIRAVTTKTSAGTEPDATFRNLSTVRIIDTILGRARATLKALLKGAGGRGAALATIVSQMTVLLAEARDEGLVNSFETPRAARDGDDPAVCVVELSFEAATAVSQIHIMAHIAV